jgi:DNA polymerase family A
MLPTCLEEFQEIWLVDFEFSAVPGERPFPICLVAKEFRSGRLIRLWQDELTTYQGAPFPTDGHCLFTSYYASAELTCFLSLGWKLPAFVLDLYAEFRNTTNGLALPCGRGLLGALAWHGLDSIGTEEKEDMRNLALRGGPWQEDERQALLDYCQSDVDALARLLPRMLPNLDLPRAFLRGRYMRAVAHMEHAGVPIDVSTWCGLTDQWDRIQVELIHQQDTAGIYQGRTFKACNWEKWVTENNLDWPRLASGNLSLSDETFRAMAIKYPEVRPYREIRSTLAKLRLNDLAVGTDGRNRCLLSAFGSRSGRNTPSNAKYVFGPSAWLRGLIKPDSGRAVAYVDYAQQEFAIAAVLSGDPAMLQAYESGDVYLAFARQAKAVPLDATKESHRETRDLFKQCVLATQYGQEAKSLAARINRSEIEARELLRLHRQTYKRFWQWSDGVEAHALLVGKLHTVFGWELKLEAGKTPNPRSLRNFPMQANGAEMLRLACSLATERGVEVVAPVHDALMIEAPIENLIQAVAITRQAMREASQAVLSGFELRSDVKTFAYPDRYRDERGAEMWERVMGLLSQTDKLAVQTDKLAECDRHFVSPDGQLVRLDRQDGGTGQYSYMSS